MNRKYAQSNTSDREIIISRLYDAPRELVFDAFTDQKRIVKWWGPKGVFTKIQVMDVRPGGDWKHIMHGPDGTDDPNASAFTEVVPPERISYEHTLTLKGAPINATEEERNTYQTGFDSMRNGFGGAMDQLDAFFAIADMMPE